MLIIELTRVNVQSLLMHVGECGAATSIIQIL